MATRSLGLMMIGLILGLLLTPSIAHLMAQQQRPSLAPPPQGPVRLILIPATIDRKMVSNGTAYFLKDTQSSGCWLSAGSIVAVAPAAACQ